MAVKGPVKIEGVPQNGASPSCCNFRTDLAAKF